MRRDKLEPIPIIKSLPVDETTKSVLIDLAMPQKGTPIRYAMEQIVLADPEETERLRIELFSYPPIAISHSQWQLWLIALHWLFRHWKPRHKLPTLDEAVKIMKPLGDVLRSILRILEYFHNYMKDFNRVNTHLMNEFAPLALEVYALYFTNLPDFGGKRAKSKEISRYAIRLRCHENAIDPELYPKLHCFIETIVSFSEADKTNDFKQKFLTKTSNSEKGLVTALSALASELNKSLCVVDVDKQALKFNTGRGKGREVFSQERLKILLS